MTAAVLLLLLAAAAALVMTAVWFAVVKGATSGWVDAVWSFLVGAAGVEGRVVADGIDHLDGVVVIPEQRDAEELERVGVAGKRRGNEKYSGEHRGGACSPQLPFFCPPSVFVPHTQTDCRSPSGDPHRSDKGPI